MKKFLLVAFPLMLIVFISGSIGQEMFKIGVVDTQKVLENYEKYIEADKLLKTAQARLKERLDAMGKDITTLQERKEKTELFVEEAQTAKLEEDIRKKQLEAQQELNRGREALLQKEKELLEPIFKDIEKLIIETGKAEKYDLILNKQAVLYVNEKYDMTDKLIKAINKNAKKDDAAKKDASDAKEDNTEKPPEQDDGNN